MNKKIVKITAVTLSAAILVGLGTLGVRAANSEGTAVKVQQPTVAHASAAEPQVSHKDETVYIFSGADGKSRNIIVSSFLQNTGKADMLLDCSDLSDIQNVKGNESFISGDRDQLTWNAAGEDIYYQGNSDRPVPVEMSISYKLDGKEITPQNLAGKSGKVTIRIDYKNNSSKTVKVDGRDRTVYVPFTMVTGIMLDTEVFRNVTVKNGRCENFGNQIAVIGLAMPGMQENLNLDKDLLELPSYVEITAEAENFSMGPSMTLATTALFTHLDTEKLSGKDLKEQAEKLTDGAAQLLDGSAKLNEGLDTLLEQADLLVDGVNQLQSGAYSLHQGTQTLQGGASQLQNGASQLSSGLHTLSGNSAALNGGAKQVFETLLSAAGSQLKAAGLEVPTLTMDNYSSVLQSVIASLDHDAVYATALEQVTAGVQAQKGKIEQAVTEGVRQQVESKVREGVTAQVKQTIAQQVERQKNVIFAKVLDGVLHMNPEQYQAAVAAGRVSAEDQAKITAAVEKAMADAVDANLSGEEAQSKISEITAQMTEEKMKSDDVKTLIAQNVQQQVEKAIADMMASDAVQSKFQAAEEGTRSVIDLKTSLDSYRSFYGGILAYTDGVDTAAQGASALLQGVNTLKDGSDSLADGAAKLSEGIRTMQGKTPALIDGITQLRDGSAALKDGITTLAKEGIEKIADLAEEDLEQLRCGLTASAEAAKSCTSFSGLAPDAKGTVKFIYKTDDISSEQ